MNEQLQLLCEDKQSSRGIDKRKPGCPVHRLVGKQSFSPDEARFYVRHQSQLRLCEGCLFFFQAHAKGERI